MRMSDWSSDVCSSDLRRKEAEPARLLGGHFRSEIAVGEHLVADDVDRAALRLRPFVDLEHDIDPVLVELHQLRFHGRGEPALAAVKQIGRASCRERVCTYE